MQLRTAKLLYLTSMEPLITTLKSIGLDDREATTYLTVLSIGTNPVSTIAKKAGLNRSSCYAVLERLLHNGFIEKVIQGNMTYFRAVEPHHLLDQLKNKQYELEAKIEGLGNNLAQFEKLKNPYEVKPKVVFFQDEAGLQNMIEDTFTSQEPLRCYAALDELSDLLPHYMPRYYKRRVQKGLKVRSIYPATEKSFLHKKRDKYELRESRLIPKEFNFHLDIMIYNNKVVITSLEEKFGVMIESKEMATAHKRIFEIIWDATRSYDDGITKIFERELEKKRNQIKQHNEEIV